MAPLPEDPSFPAVFGNDPVEPEQAYGPIRFRRYVKDDGRVLILYVQGEPTDRGPANERPLHE
jgi:hypothetical protein